MLFIDSFFWIIWFFLVLLLLLCFNISVIILKYALYEKPVVRYKYKRVTVTTCVVVGSIITRENKYLIFYLVVSYLIFLFRFYKVEPMRSVEFRHSISNVSVSRRKVGSGVS